MSPEKSQDFRGVSLKRELVEQIEKFIQDYPEYKNISDFVHEAVRIRMEQILQLKPKPLPRFSLFNKDEHGCKVQDRLLGVYAQIYFKPDGKIICEVCNTSDCEHIKFALKEPSIQKILRKKKAEGWKLPDV